MLKKITNIFLDELSKVKLLRDKSQYLSNRYFNEVAISTIRLKFLRGVPQRIFYSRQPWYYAPKHFAGGLVLNTLGYGVLRQYFFSKKIKKIKSSKEYRSLEVNGVQTIPRFVDGEFVETIKSYYQENLHKRQEYVPGFNELIISSNLKHIDIGPSDQEIFKYIESKINFKKVFYEMTSTQLRVMPWISIVHHISKSNTDEEFIPQLDGNNIPHRDVTFPSYKIFIYLNDVDDKNGAFQYYEGTHKLIDQSNIYKYSIEHYWARNSKPIDQVKNLGLPSRGIAQEGNAGAAVFFNAAGIHRRGNFERDRDRERMVLLIDFRQNDAPYIPKNLRYSH
jgi:hypothetical protein